MNMTEKKTILYLITKSDWGEALGKPTVFPTFLHRGTRVPPTPLRPLLLFDFDWYRTNNLFRI